MVYLTKDEMVNFYGKLVSKKIQNRPIEWTWENISETSMLRIILGGSSQLVSG